MAEGGKHMIWPKRKPEYRMRWEQEEVLDIWDKNLMESPVTIIRFFHALSWQIFISYPLYNTIILNLSVSQLPPFFMLFLSFQCSSPFHLFHFSVLVFLAPTFFPSYCVFQGLTTGRRNGSIHERGGM